MDEKEIERSKMDQAEIKELYAEELSLLKRISNYGKDFPKENQVLQPIRRGRFRFSSCQLGLF